MCISTDLVRHCLWANNFEHPQPFLNTVEATPSTLVFIELGLYLASLKVFIISGREPIGYNIFTYLVILGLDNFKVHSSQRCNLLIF
jgi:hypothetical protein